MGSSWGSSWGLSFGNSWGPIQVEENPTFGPWCVGGDDEKPNKQEVKHTYGRHPFFRPIDLPQEAIEEIDTLVVEQTQVEIKKQQASKATAEYWALQAHEQMLRLEADRVANEAIQKAQEIRDMDIAFVMMMLEEG